MAVNGESMEVCNELSTYSSHLRLEAKLRYLQKLNGCGNSNYYFPDPYNIPNSEWKDDISMWPPVSFGDIYIYLRTDSNNAFDEVALKNYKSLAAYEYVISGKVQRVKLFHGKETKFCILSAEVQRSQRLSEKNHHPWVIVEDNGSIKTAHCTCMAGLGEACSHIAALLFKIELAFNIYHNTVSPTDEACKWNNSFSSKTVESDTVQNLELSKHQWSSQKRKRVVNCIPVPKLPKYSPQEMEHLNTICPNAVCITATYNGSSTESASDSEDDGGDMPPTIIQVMKRALQMKEHFKAFILKCYTNQNCDNLRKATVLQSTCPLWHAHRKGRFTASNFKKLIKRKKEWNEEFTLSLLKSENLSTPAVKWGKEHESDALKAYEEQMCCQHINFRLERCGLIVHPEMPHMGASPDGKTRCDCCGIGLVEVKCPYKHRDVSIKTAIANDKLFCLSTDGVLKTNHKYYYQVQGGMALSEIYFCDFVVWTPVDLAINRIEFQEDTWSKDKVILEQRFYNHMISTLRKAVSEEA